jgi:hypothetical protein
MDGSEVIGRIASNTDDSVTLVVSLKKESREEVISLTDIKRALVEIEFSRKDDK